MQVPGVVFDADDRDVLANMLALGGIDMLDIGLPGSMQQWRQLAEFSHGLQGRIATGVTVRAVREDLIVAADYGFESVFMLAPASELHLKYKFQMTRANLRQRIEHLSALAMGLKLKPIWIAEDASRGSKALVRDFVAWASGAGATAIYLCDTVGVLVPSGVDAWITTAREGLRRGAPVPLGVHCHNDFGMATANTVTAAACGVEWLSTTVSGLGERAGNASTLEVAAGLDRLLAMPNAWNLSVLAAAEREVEKRTGIPLAMQAPLVGWNAFRHESGIHVDGVLKLPRIYEPLDPEDLGAERTLVLGATSGRAHLRYLLTQMNIQVSEDQLELLFARLRHEATRKPASKEVFLAAYYGYLRELGISESVFRSLVQQILGT